jgi:hypothetical protein
MFRQVVLIIIVGGGAAAGCAQARTPLPSWVCVDRTSLAVNYHALLQTTDLDHCVVIRFGVPESDGVWRTELSHTWMLLARRPCDAPYIYTGPASSGSASGRVTDLHGYVEIETHGDDVTVRAHISAMFGATESGEPPEFASMDTDVSFIGLDGGIGQPGTCGFVTD